MYLQTCLIQTKVLPQATEAVAFLDVSSMKHALQNDSQIDAEM